MSQDMDITLNNTIMEIETEDSFQSQNLQSLSNASINKTNKIHFIWKYTVDFKKCLFCNKEWKYPKVEVIARHLANKNCKLINGNLITMKQQALNSIQELTNRKQTSEISQDSNKRRKVNSDERSDISLNERQAAFNKEMSLYHYTSGVAFRAIENQHLKNAISILDNTISLPSPYMLSNSLLNEQHSTLHEIINKKIQDHVNKGFKLTLVTDGYTTNSNCSLINYIVGVGDEYFFIKSEDVGDYQHTGIFLAKKIREFMDTYGGIEAYAGIVCDNHQANISAHCELIKQYPLLLFQGCYAHTLNLVVKEFLEFEPCKSYLAHACELVKFFKHRHIPNSRLKKRREKENVTVNLHLFAATRWGSCTSMLDSLLCNKECMRIESNRDDFLRLSSASDYVKKSQWCKNKLHNTDFWNQLKDMYETLKLVSDNIKESESESYSISAILEDSSRIATQLMELSASNEYCSQMHNCMVNRMNAYITNLHKFTYMIDPTNNGSLIGTEAEMVMLDWASSFVSSAHSIMDFKTDYIGFKAIKLNYGEQDKMAIKQAGIRIYWMGITEFPRLKQVAVTLLSLPATSCASERNWSNFSFVLNPIRSNLAASRASKLVFVYSNQRKVEKIRDIPSMDLLNQYDSHPSEFLEQFTCVSMNVSEELS